MKNFSGTRSALWAEIEIAQNQAEKKEFDIAVEKYSKVLNDLPASDPLLALVTFGRAQAEEGRNNFEKAIGDYSVLKTTVGYESIGYTGAARILEIQGKAEEAITELEQYLGVLMGDNPNNSEKIIITEKISRLKATL